MIDKGEEAKQLEKKLCQANKEVIWAIGKNNQCLSFNDGALMPSWKSLFKLVCNRLIPITHTSYVTLDQAILLYAIIEKKKVNTEWIIYNNNIDSIGPNKGLWLATIITKLYAQSGVDNEKNEESINVGLAIIAKASTNAPQIGPRLGMEMLEEIKDIRVV